MIIPNGYIEIKRVIGGGLDPETGYAIPAQGEWGERIACQYSAKSYKHAAKVDVEFYTLASYELLIDALNVEEQWYKSAAMVRLSTNSGVVLGEYPIIRVEHLAAVRAFQITL